MLNIVNFIHAHENWEELLSSPPYSLLIKRKDKRILFKYSQINSDPSLEIVKEARGLILEDKTFNIIAFPFKRFYNYGEPYADTIDWSTTIVSSKEDGSLIKIYYYNGWKVGTSGTIDAEDAELSSPPYHNFRELFDEAAKNSNFDFDKLDPHYTYLMELCSCFNKIVVPYGKPKLFHIGTRDNRTLKEIEIDIGIEKPKIYELSSLNDCIAMAATFDFKKEGFVCRDKNYHRIKIKGEDYLKAHRLINNNTLTLERAIDLIQTNEVSEFISYFPHFEEYIKKVKSQYNEMIRILQIIQHCTERIKAELLKNYSERVAKKMFADIISDSPYKAFYFDTWKGVNWVEKIANITSKERHICNKIISIFFNQ